MKHTFKHRPRCRWIAYFKLIDYPSRIRDAICASFVGFGQNILTAADIVILGAVLQLRIVQNVVIPDPCANPCSLLGIEVEHDSVDLCAPSIILGTQLTFGVQHNILCLVRKLKLQCGGKLQQDFDAAVCWLRLRYRQNFV